jgi:hypothetical protein
MQYLMLNPNHFKFLIITHSHSFSEIILLKLATYSFMECLSLQIKAKFHQATRIHQNLPRIGSQPLNNAHLIV